MNNVKGYAIANDGAMKRIAITYDVINEETGKPVQANVKTSAMVVDKEVLAAIGVIDAYAQKTIDNAV